jgi:cell division protein FtsL
MEKFYFIGIIAILILIIYIIHTQGQNYLNNLNDLNNLISEENDKKSENFFGDLLSLTPVQRCNKLKVDKFMIRDLKTKL